MGESQSVQKLLPDQSFSVSTGDLTLLQKVETAIATYANGVMQKLGKYQPFPNSNAGVGTQTSGFFPPGVVDVKKKAFVETGGAGPVAADSMAPSYPGKIAEGDKVTIIETSEELTLTGDATLGLVGRSLSVSEKTSSHLLVFGNVVSIRGKISAPGKHIVIVAREVRTVAAAGGKEQAEINVDGAPPAAAKLPKPQAPSGTDGSPAQWSWEPFEFKKKSARGGTWGHDGEDGQPGNAGKAAGEIYILCDTLPAYSDLTLHATGGAGQDGQPGQKGGDGGAGGNGQARMENYLCWYLPPGAGGLGGFGGRGGPGGQGGNSGNCIVIVNKAIDNPTMSAGSITVVAQPGAPGQKGGREDGSRGSRGEDDPIYLVHRYATIIQSDEGYLAREPLPDLPDPPPAKRGRYLLCHNVDVTSSSETVNSPYKDLRGIAQVSHLHKLLETARLRYLRWDAYRFAQDSEADDIKHELVALLDFLLLGLRLLPPFVSENDLNVLDGIRNTVLSLTKRLAAEVDYFGQTKDYVPLGSPNVYYKPLKDTLDLLEKREENYTEYTQALKDAKASQEQLATAIGDAKKHIEALEKNTNLLHATLLNYVTKKIPGEDRKVAGSREKLKPQLDQLKTWVTSCFGLTPEDFIECVFNLAFIGSPLQAGKGGKDVASGHGVFTALTTISSQSAKLINKAVETLPDDEGQPVNRKHLLRKVDLFSKKLTDLSEAYSTVQNGRHSNDPELIQLDDPDAYRLLVVQEEFNNLLEQFSTKPEAQTAMDAMEKYVNAVQARNAVLADYNTLVTEYLGVAGDVSTTKGQISTIEQLTDINAEPNLPTQTAFVTALYNRTRERCIEQFYLASRAYRFWSLEPETALYSTLKLGSPNEMNYTVLDGAAEELLNQRTKHITSKLDESKKKNNIGMLQRFPSEEDSKNQTGISVILQPKNVYRVRFLSGATSNDLPSPALVFVALIDLKLHIRIFDTDGKQVVDKTEDDLPSGAHLTALKQCFDVTRSDLLRTAYGWKREYVETLSAEAQRRAVINKLCQLSKHSAAYFEGMNDYDLDGKGAVLTFLRGAKIRSDHELTRMKIADQFMALMVSNNKHVYKPLEEQLDIRGGDGHKLVQIGFEWADAGFVRSRMTELSAKDKETILEAVASITEFQPPNASRVRFLSAAPGADIPSEKPDDKRALVIVALIDLKLHIRIFDTDGNVVVDKAEDELPSGVHLTALKQCFDVTRRDLLCTAYGWTRDHVNKLSAAAQRQAVIDKLCQLSTHPAADFEGKNDYELVGRGAVLMFLLGAKIRRDDQLKRMDIGGQLNTLIVENDKHVDMPYQEQWDTGEDVHKLVQIGFEWADAGFVRSRMSELSAEDEETILDTVTTITKFPLARGYPKEFAEFKRTGVASFTIPAPSPDSIKKDNPFAPFFNTRITKVRAWVRGVKTGSPHRCHVLLQTQGSEVICATDLTHIPFVHPPIPAFSFVYEYTKVKWNEEDQYVENPAEVLSIDGSLMCVGDYKDSSYPPVVGPFTEWKIILTGGKYNTDLDRTEIEAIHLEFHGFQQTYEREMPSQ
jgi:hypothetical protein